MWEGEGRCAAAVWAGVPMRGLLNWGACAQPAGDCPPWPGYSARHDACRCLPPHACIRQLSARLLPRLLCSVLRGASGRGPVKGGAVLQTGGSSSPSSSAHSRVACTAWVAHGSCAPWSCARAPPCCGWRRTRSSTPCGRSWAGHSLVQGKEGCG